MLPPDAIGDVGMFRVWGARTFARWTQTSPRSSRKAARRAWCGHLMPLGTLAGVGLRVQDLDAGCGARRARYRNAKQERTVPCQARLKGARHDRAVELGFYGC